MDTYIPTETEALCIIAFTKAKQKAKLDCGVRMDSHGRTLYSYAYDTLRTAVEALSLSLYALDHAHDGAGFTWACMNTDKVEDDGGMIHDRWRDSRVH